MFQARSTTQLRVPNVRRNVIAGRAALALAIIFAILGIVISMRPRSLLALARPVADCADWCGPSFWISNREIACPSPGDGSGLPAGAVDVETRQQRPLSALSRALDRIQAPSNRFTSPDGRWILMDRLNTTPYYDAISTDGTRYVRWPKPDSEESHGGRIPWLADSRRWVHLVKSGKRLEAVIRSLDDPSSRKVISWPNDKHGSASGFVGISASLQNDRVITAELFAKMPSTIHVTWRKRDLLRGTVEEMRVPITGADEIEAVEASPGGREIAWLAWHKREARPEWLMRFLRIFGASDKDFVSLRVTDENGSHQREIGRVQVDVVSMMAHGFISTRPRGPSELNWSPDGRCLSFRFEGKLWVLPIR